MTYSLLLSTKDTTAKEFSYGDLVANGIYVEDLEDTKDEAVSEAVSAALQAMMPVGFVVTLGVSTNPATLYGFGTWSRIQGRVVVGVSDSDGDFDLNDTGGAKTHTLTIAEMPSHNHSINDPGGWGAGSANSGRFRADLRSSPANQWAMSIAYTGSGGAHNNMQPYIAKYVWERTA